MASFTIYAVSEEEGSRTENFGLESTSIKTTLRCTSNIRYLVANDLLLNRRQWPFAISAGQVSSPRCSDVAIRPDSCLGTDGQAMVYTDALLDVTYSSLDNVDLVAESLEDRADFITLDHNQFRWGAANGDPLKEEEAPGRLLKSFDWVRTHYNVTSIPAELLTLVGSCNNAPITSPSLGLTFSAETLLFNPLKPRRTLSTQGRPTWTVTTRFSYNPLGWNTYWRAKTQTYDSLFEVSSGSIYRSYPANNFGPVINLV